MKIGTASAEPGEKAFGFLKVMRRVDGSDAGFPIIIVNGSEKGPVLLIDACHHGDEPEGCEAVLRFAKELEPNKLKGVFIGVPVLNVEAFQARSRVSPVDFQDMNRIYPGKDVAATLSEKVVYVYLNEVVSKANYLITCHGGGAFAGAITYSHVPAWEDSETIKKSIEMAKAFGLNFKTKTTPSFAGYLPTHGIQKGIPTLLVESGTTTDAYNNREYYVNLLLRGFRNVMKYLGMLEGKLELPPKQLLFSGTIRGRPTPALRSNCGGLWIPSDKKPFDSVKKGTLLGRIVSPFNIDEEFERIEAPHDGLVLTIHAHPVIHPGETVAYFGELLEEIKNI